MDSRRDGFPDDEAAARRIPVRPALVREAPPPPPRVRFLVEFTRVTCDGRFNPMVGIGCVDFPAGRIIVSGTRLHVQNIRRGLFRMFAPALIQDDVRDADFERRKEVRLEVDPGRTTAVWDARRRVAGVETAECGFVTFAVTALDAPRVEALLERRYGPMLARRRVSRMHRNDRRAMRFMVGVVVALLLLVLAAVLLVLSGR